MAGEQVEGLPDALQEWVYSRAEETGRAPQEVLARAVSVSRLLDAEADSLPTPDTLGDTAAAPDDLTDQIADLDRRVQALDDDLDEKIDDVRSRVIQVKREADAKAEADHDHPDLQEAVDSLASLEGLDAELDSLAADLDSLRTDVEALEARFEEGFDNYEEVLEYLTDTTDDHDAKLSTLARVVADLRTRVAKQEARESQRRAAEELQTEANRHGITKATCDSCGATVQLALLSVPECPHCAATFESVEPASGFLGSPSLSVGHRPALEGETVEETDPSDIFEGM
ncbi:CopG family transcriptional regulator [Halobaculum limi]|uniref:CopG family transcriptional regulator n=1 Tax=Halobaculum limi TaxID=3031916 RepID=UPI0024061020|nr:CopG family transcriptional regulator [Halobaculum sp. YSMS11]